MKHFHCSPGLVLDKNYFIARYVKVNGAWDTPLLVLVQSGIRHVCLFPHYMLMGFCNWTNTQLVRGRHIDSRSRPSLVAKATISLTYPPQSRQKCGFQISLRKQRNRCIYKVVCSTLCTVHDYVVMHVPCLNFTANDRKRRNPPRIPGMYIRYNDTVPHVQRSRS
jgi:hypothetical protein